MAGLRKFSDIDKISPESLQVLKTLGFETATPVQEATIPLLAGNKDVAVDAATGSGKTLAFVIPIVEKLRRLDEKLKKHQIGAIVISPTRELAKQILAVADPFIESVPGLSSLLLVGGTDPSQDVALFKENGGNVLVGTPGRIDDFLRRCSIAEMKTLEMLVLDEADRLLDMGFQRQLDAIMTRLPKQRRTGLFSATQTEAVEALARAGLRNPVRVNVKVTAAPSTSGGKQQGDAGGESKTPSTLELSYVVCEPHQKLPQLVSFLASHRDQKCIVYFLTCASVEYFANVMRRMKQLAGTELSALHGKMKQAQREATLAAFTTMPAGCLLCTDLAARGLDIPNVHWIVQFDPPQNPDQFVHRVGRTARMGRSGNALVYLMPQESTYVEFLRLRKVHLHEVPAEADAPDVLPLLRHEAEGDREVMEKATRALVSYIRAYKEHHCKYIFRLQELDLGYLATSFGVLRMPKMKEVRKARGLDHFTPSSVEPDSVRFKDKAREKQRQAMLKQRAAAANKDEARAEARERSREKQQQQKQAEVRLTGAKRKKLQALDEEAELAAEYSLLRKLKKGKISDRQFDAATGLTVGEGGDDEEPGQGAAAPGASDSEGSGSDGSDSGNAEAGLNPRQQQARAPKPKLPTPGHRHPGDGGGPGSVKKGKAERKPGTVLQQSRLGVAIDRKLRKKKRKQGKEKQQGRQG